MGGKSSKGSKNKGHGHPGAVEAARQTVLHGTFGKEFKSFPTKADTDELLSGPRAQPLIRSVKTDTCGFAKLISAGKFDPNECLDSQKMAPAHFATLLKSEASLSGLLSIPNLDLNIGNKDGDTPLMLLLKACNSEAEAIPMATSIINDSRCVVETKNRIGATALSIAVAKGFERITRLLVNEGRIKKYSFPSLAMTFKFALMFEQERQIQTIFRTMDSKTQTEFMEYFSKEGPEFYEVSQLLKEVGYSADDIEPALPNRLTISQENLVLFAARCTMAGTPEYFTQQKSVDAEGHEIFVGNLVRFMSEDVVRKMNPRLDEEDDDFVEAVAEEEAFVHDIDDDGDLYVDTTDTPYSGYVSSKSVIFVNQGPRVEIGDGTKVGIGYLVKVDSDEAEVEALAKGHGGWKPEYKACCGRTGRVRKIDRGGDIFVYFSWGARVCFNPMALSVSSSDEIEAKDFDGNWMIKGAYARVTDDMSEFTSLQEEIGVPIDEKYKEIMGKLVTIHRIRVYMQFTHAIARHGKIAYNLNPSCLRLVTSAKDSNGNDIKIGDVVTVLNEIDRVKTLQTAKYGSWSEKMASVIGSTGVVVDVDINPGTRESVAQVQFSDSSFYMNPKVLRTSSGRKGSLLRDTGYDSHQQQRQSSSLMLPRSSETGSTHSAKSMATGPPADPNEGLQIIPREDLITGRKIGEGGFGKVTLGSWRGTDCAIKQIRSIVTSGLEYEELLKEAKIQFSLKHPNIVQLYGISYTDDLWMVMQFIQGRDLFDILFGDDGSSTVLPCSSRRIQFSCKVKIAIQTTNALSYLHGKGYIHNDMKPENIIVEKRTGNVFVCDFGITQFLGNTNIQTFSAKYTISFGGTLPYIAPECFDKDESKKKYLRPTFKSDVWAVGAIFAELFAQEQLFTDENEIYKCKLMKDFTRVKKFVKVLPANVRPILQKALEALPGQRPTCKDMNTFFFDLSRSAGVVPSVTHK